MKLAKLVNPFKVEKGRHFRLKQVDPADTLGLSLDRDSAADLLKEGVERLAELQERLYAERRWARRTWKLACEPLPARFPAAQLLRAVPRGPSSIWETR